MESCATAQITVVLLVGCDYVWCCKVSVTEPRCARRDVSGMSGMSGMSGTRVRVVSGLKVEMGCRRGYAQI
ncbi:MAG: hypothetical protein J3Q66DRAFT_341744 [Benniella sp.]|nr:MAG: hypothetical protein J3Q66DRAFT_341744 [Benniella sp.]